MTLSSNWKKIEKSVAIWFPGHNRRGASYGTGFAGSGKNDLIPRVDRAKGWSIEVKHGKSLSVGDAEAAVEQARRAAEVGDIPVAVIHGYRENVKNSLVFMTRKDFLDFFGNGDGWNLKSVVSKRPTMSRIRKEIKKLREKATDDQVSIVYTKREDQDNYLVVVQLEEFMWNFYLPFLGDDEMLQRPNEAGYYWFYPHSKTPPFIVEVVAAPDIDGGNEELVVLYNGNVYDVKEFSGEWLKDNPVQ